MGSCNKTITTPKTMNIENDLLIDYEERVTYKPFIKTLITKIYTIQNVIYLAAYFVTLNTLNIEWRTHLQSKLNFSVFIFERILPFLGIFLFIRRKQPGWVLVSILSILDLLFKAYNLINVSRHLDEYISGSLFPLILQALVFVFASVVPILLFTKSVNEIFKLNTKIKLSVIGLALAIFLAVRFYM